MPTIAALNVHPVKGCRAIALECATVTVRGLATDTAGDREWMVVDAHGRFASQREHPRMALIGVSAHASGLAFTAPAMPLLEVAFADPARAARRDVVVWNSTVAAIDAGDAPARWLTAYLGPPMRLVRFAPEHVRACNAQFVGASGAHTAFADGYPALVIGQASLADLNERLAARGHRALPMNRFRPNVVIAGLEPYDEDHVDTIEAAGVTLKLVKPCVRCRVTTTDQDDASVGSEPLATLASYRMDERRDGVTFGMNAIVVAGAGRTLAVGSNAAIDYRF
jgi:uncharacterized protein